MGCGSSLIIGAQVQLGVDGAQARATFAQKLNPMQMQVHVPLNAETALVIVTLAQESGIGSAS